MFLEGECAEEQAGHSLWQFIRLWSVKVGGLDTFLAWHSTFIALGMEEMRVQRGKSEDMQEGK